MPYKDPKVAREYENEYRRKRWENEPEYQQRIKARKLRYPGTCAHCGMEFKGREPTSRFCSRSCAGKAIWTEGTANTFLPAKPPQAKYVTVRRPGHPMADKQGRIYEHRLVMAEALGRMLSRLEVVHHKNGNPRDNQIENLELVTPNTHGKHHMKHPRK